MKRAGIVDTQAGIVTGIVDTHDLVHDLVIAGSAIVDTHNLKPDLESGMVCGEPGYERRFQSDVSRRLGKVALA